MTRRRGIRRRGHYLLTFGVVQLLLGILAVQTVEVDRLTASPARLRFLDLLNPPLYAAASVAVFVLCVAAVVLRPPRLERFAFTGLAALAAVRVGLLVVAAFTGPGVDSGLLSQAVVFLLILRVHVLVAGWPEPGPDLVLDEHDWNDIAQEMRRRLDP